MKPRLWECLELKPCVTRRGKSSSVEEVCAQGWVGEEGRACGDTITLWPKVKGQDMMPFSCMGRRRWSLDEQQIMNGFWETLLRHLAVPVSHALGRDCEVKVTLQLNWGIKKRGRRESPVWVGEMGRSGEKQRGTRRWKPNP